ncbi:MAG: hypothetical protein INR69_13790 [Mucilaginibacter polytrichastri]|nr:hypothetical protein [Mucilaginibacter polytrichastri]
MKTALKTDDRVVHTAEPFYNAGNETTVRMLTDDGSRAQISDGNTWVWVPVNELKKTGVKKAQSSR